MNSILAQLLTWTLGTLGKFIVAFIRNLAHGDSLGQAAADAALEIVRSMDLSTTLTNTEKRDAAVTALKAWHYDLGRPPPPDHVCNTLIELAVSKLRADAAAEAGSGVV